jgi:hypothetical protein
MLFGQLTRKLFDFRILAGRNHLFIEAHQIRLLLKSVRERLAGVPACMIAPQRFV